MVRKLFLTPPNTPLETECRTLQIPSSKEWLGIFNACLLLTTQYWNYEQVQDSDLTVDETVLLAKGILDEYWATAGCMIDVEAPYWDDATADDADDTAPADDQPWYGEIVSEDNTWREQVGIWAIAAFVAIAATPAAAISFIPLANRMVLAFKQHNLGAIVKVFIDGAEVAKVDTYAPANGVKNVTISIPAPAMGFRAFDAEDELPVMWVMMTDEVNPAVDGDPSMIVIRKRLTATEVTPSNIRWNEDCDCVQTSPDDGVTWVDTPTQDPRSSTMFQVPPRISDDPRCDSAQQMHDRVKNMLDAIITSSTILQAINTVVQLMALFFFEVGIIIEAVWAIVSAIFGVGTTVLDAALTEGVYDEFLCILDCNISANGTVTEAQFNTIIDAINENIETTAAFALTQMLYNIGFVGLTNAGALGEVTGDCADCGCGWTVVHDFSIANWGYIPQGDCPQAYASGTWHATADCGDIGGARRVWIEIPIDMPLVSEVTLCRIYYNMSDPVSGYAKNFMRNATYAFDMNPFFPGVNIKDVDLTITTSATYGFLCDVPSGVTLTLNKIVWSGTGDTPTFG